MKENEAIRQLKQLKAIKPSDHALESMKRDIFYLIQTDKSQHSFFNILQLSPVFVYGTLALAIFLLVLTNSIIPLSSVVEKTYLMVQITFAQNKYQKANIAFVYAEEKLIELKNSNGQLSASQIENVSQATNLANTQLASLNLVGEEGKYTGAQCQQLYKKYYNYLEEAKNAVALKAASPNDNISETSIQLLNTQLEAYEQQAKVRLNHY